MAQLEYRITVDSSKATSLLAELAEINAPALVALIGEGEPLFALQYDLSTAGAPDLFGTLEPTERMLDFAATLRTGYLDRQLVEV